MKGIGTIVKGGVTKRRVELRDLIDSKTRDPIYLTMILRRLKSPLSNKLMKNNHKELVLND